MFGRGRIRHLTVNHSIHFKNPGIGAHTNNIEGMWCHFYSIVVKKHFYSGYLTKFMVLKRCRSINVDSLPEFFKCVGKIYNPEQTITKKNNAFDESAGSEIEIY